MGVGFETTTGPSGPSRSRETWHVLFSFTNERGEICDLTSNRVPHVFLKGFFLEPPQKKNHVPKNFKWWRFWSEKKNTDHLFWGSKNFTSKFWGRHSTLDQQGSTTGPSLWRKLQVTPPKFYSKRCPQKNGNPPKGNENLVFLLHPIFRGYVKNFGAVSSHHKTPRFFTQWF